MAQSAETESLSFEIRPNAGFFTEGKWCADLNSCGTETQSLGELAGTAIGTRQPEGKPKGPNLLQVGHVALTVKGFAGGGKLQASPRGGVVAAGSRAFNNEAIDVSAGFFGQRHGKGCRSNDAEELWPVERRHYPAAKTLRIESGEVFLA